MIESLEFVPQDYFHLATRRGGHHHPRPWKAERIPKRNDRSVAALADLMAAANGDARVLDNGVAYLFLSPPQRDAKGIFRKESWGELPSFDFIDRL